MKESNHTAPDRVWPMAPIGETGRYINGLAFKPSDWHDEGLPIIRIQNLTDPSKPFNRTTKTVDPAYIVEPGDLLVSWSATLDAFIWRGSKAILNQHIFKVVPNEKRATRFYLYYALKRAIAEMTRTEHLHGSTMKHINRGPFMAHRVPLPALDIQERIVAEIEKQFSRLDEAVANLKRVKANLKRYKAAVLKAAVEGRLVETEAELARREDRSYETGEQLLQRILETRRSQWKGKGKYKEPAAPDTTDLPELPEGWVWVSLDQLTTQIADVDHKMPKPYEGGIPYVSTKDFIGESEIDFDGAKRISPSDFEALCRKVRPVRGDILLSRYGTVGEVRTVGTDLPFQASYSVAILKPVRGEWHSAYLSTCLKSEVIQTQIKRDVRATAQPDLGLAHIRQFLVPVPPLDEQHRIDTEVDRRLSHLRKTEAQVDANLQRAGRLRQSVLSWAFSGSLSRIKEMTSSPIECLGIASGQHCTTHGDA